MKDYVTAKERLATPWIKETITNFLWTMFSVVMITMCVYELLREVNYVN